MIKVVEGRWTLPADADVHAGAHSDWHPLESQHALLRVRAEYLESTLAHLAQGVCAGEDGAGSREARRLLRDFRELLFDHLASEEAGGVLELAVTTAPRLQGRLEKLRREHVGLRHRMDALVGSVGVAGWVRIHTGFVSLRCVLREHDHAENDVLQRAYLEDLGGGD